MPAARRIIIVANSKSGSTAANALDQLITALRTRGAEVEALTTEQPAQLSALAKKACESKPDVAVAFGGDGTVNTLANALAGSTVPMGIAPRGTFNYVAKQYGLPESPEDIAELLTTGSAQPIAAGEVNGKLFLNNCSFGLYTDVIEARERHKAQWGRYRLVAVISALATALRSTARLPLKLAGAENGTHHHGRASLFFAGVNPRQFADSGFEISDAVAAGALGFVVVDTISAGRIVKMIAGAAAGTVEQLQHVTAFTDTALRAEVLRRRPLKVVIDGELLRMNSPLQFNYRAAALQLVMPASPQIAVAT
ncbi:MAG: diacylglycerol kinase family protein [Stagnimonas sp.]|nr:diacylglycerol kinase family protein [Stagnimonas sp.]